MRGVARFGGDVELAVGALDDSAAMQRALHGVRVLFLACGNDPQQAELEISAIDTAVASGVRRIVKLSSVGAEIGSPLAFWDAHGRSEAHLRRAPVESVVLRPSFLMSNLLASAATVRSQRKIFAPAAGARIAMIDPRDVAAAAAAILTSSGHAGGTYMFTGPEAITYERVAADLSAAVGRQIQFVPVPDDAAYRTMTATGMPEWYATQLVTLFRLLRQGAAAETSDSVSELTGRVPRSFRDFARDYAPAFGARAAPRVSASSPSAPQPSAPDAPRAG
jgi:uncharacterized protein YbjT (DUF2867 family)